MTVYHVERCTFGIGGETVWQVSGPGGYLAQFAAPRDADACREALERECARWAAECLDRLEKLGGTKA